MFDFTYQTEPQKVVFGQDKRKTIKEEMAEWGAERVLIVSTPGRKKEAEEAARLLGNKCVGIHDKAVQHVPEETIDVLVNEINETRADALAAIGGGSPIGLAKAAVLQVPLPILALPTTYSGSELTTVWGITKNGQKQTGKDPIVKPKTIIYDPELTKSMPASLSLVSGVNAMAHCVEALYAENRNPVTSIMAEEGIRALAASLGEIVKQPDNMEARAEAFYGGWLAGSALSAVGMALHHKLSHVLGGSFQLPHAKTHTVILPHAAAYNASYAPEAMKAVARALGREEHDAAGAIYDFIKANDGPVSLAEIGMKKEDVAKAADQVTKNAYYNPRPISKTAIQELLEKAYNGERPVPEMTKI
ncbi:maleylacetate reductase [Alteribacillus sp. YIM 98480]|uniref:maleylacetate reductase n=1 Tax=Alteribacillus sp. YIM 98480 TaxID=2606599 RepID=UPI00131B4974|nr:maleylacetate reductase [Alteribacillus sp. YIM 98480]